jgi:hypothetical protein
MAEYQTTSTDLNLIRGSGKIEVAPYIDGDPTWFDVGGIIGLTVTENQVISTEEFDNAVYNKRVSKQEVTIAFTQLELLNLDVWEIMRGNLDTITQETNNVKIQSGNKSTINDFMVRITTKNDDNGPIYFMAYRCTINKGFELAYQKDDGEDRRLQNAVEILGRSDANRGDLVYEIESTAFNG